MKRLLNTLYVTTQGSYLRKEGETVSVRIEGEEKFRVPIHTLESIVCFGQVSASPALFGYCAANGVTVSFLTRNNRFLARVEGPVSGNVLLRREQYRRADDPIATASLARSMIMAKVANQRSVVRRVLRDHGNNMDGTERAKLENAAQRFGNILRRLRLTQGNVDELRGLEGEAGREYFSIFNNFVTGTDVAFIFHERTRRPPRDPINCLLSFVYTLLLHDVRSALETVGLDPSVGFLHRDRPGRHSLALDLMEEFRPFFADRLVLSLINRGQVTGDGFNQEETGGTMMNDDTRKTVLISYQERKSSILTHPFIGEKAPLGLMWHLQARLLNRHLRGDLDSYPSFFWK